MLSKFSVKKPYTVVVAIILVLILGVVSYTKMTVDLIPSINLPYAVIATSYIGASPEEVETVVTSTLEQTMASVNNIKNISSISSENMSMIILEFNEDTNMDSAMIEMRESLDMVTAYFPEEIGSPMIFKLNPDMMPIAVISTSVEGMTDQESAKYIEDNIIPEIKSVDGVASVTPSGLIENMIDVTLSEVKINALKEKIQGIITEALGTATFPENALTTDISSVEITKEMIAGILSGQSFAMPAGSISSEDGTSYLVRVGEKITNVDELKSLKLMEIPLVGDILLSDVADIGLYDNSNTMYSRVDGNHAIMLQLQKQPNFSTADVSNSVFEKIDKLTADNENLKFTTLMDQGEYVDLMINSIIKNLLFGAAFAIIILFIFLRKIKPTLIVGTSIFISVIAAFVLMYFFGITLNMVSMGGLTLGVGMLVDNSIVVIENIYRLRAEGKSAKEAAVEGAKEVAGAITASTLTTIVVFVPIVFTSGITKELFTDMALTIAFSLIASLLVALTLVPAAASTMLNKNFETKPNFIDKMTNGYVKLLDKSLKHNWLALLVAVVLLGGSILAALSSGTELFPEMDTGTISVTIDVPDKFTKEEIFTALDLVTETISVIPDIETVGAMYSSTSSEMSFITSMAGTGIQSYVLLKEDHKKSTNEIVEEIRTKTQDFDFEVTVSGSNMDMSMLSGGQIVINVYGRDLDKLRLTATEISDIINTIEGSTEVDNGLGKTSEEIRVVVNKEKAISKGLTVAQVYMAVSSDISTARSTLSITDGESEYAVFVKDDREKPITYADLSKMTITSPTGEVVTISDVADIVNAEGFTSINHNGQERYVTVTGSLLDGYDTKEVNDKIEEALEKYDLPSGIRYEIAGESESMNDTFKDLFLMLAMAIVFIYLIMVAQFQSLKSPFIVMFTLPLAFTGGFFALFFTGSKISVISIIGFIVLVGVVVNNGIVFVDYANQQMQKGLTCKDALLLTARNRIRPILMTALTTVIALVMMAFDTGSGSELMRPMAITTIGGMTYGTILTLFIVPAIYAITHKVKKNKKAVKAK